MVDVPEDFKYTEDHEWLKLDGKKATYGVSDYAQEELGDIVYVELPEEDDEVEKGDMIGVVESVKTVSDLFSPLSGKIVKVNYDLEDVPETINEDPYEEGWIAVIEYSDEEEIKELLSAEKYKEHIK